MRLTTSVSTTVAVLCVLNVMAAGAEPASKPAAPGETWGLYDMHGNVMEWCAEENRPLRGGAWNSYAGQCKTAHADTGRPDLRKNDIGFRCALDLPLREGPERR